MGPALRPAAQSPARRRGESNGAHALQSFPSLHRPAEGRQLGSALPVLSCPGASRGQVWPHRAGWRATLRCLGPGSGLPLVDSVPHGGAGMRLRGAQPWRVSGPSGLGGEVKAGKGGPGRDPQPWRGASTRLLSTPSQLTEQAAHVPVTVSPVVTEEPAQTPHREAAPSPPLGDSRRPCLKPPPRHLRSLLRARLSPAVQGRALRASSLTPTYSPPLPMTAALSPSADPITPSLPGVPQPRPGCTRPVGSCLSTCLQAVPWSCPAQPPVHSRFLLPPSLGLVPTEWPQSQVSRTQSLAVSGRESEAMLISRGQD